jgi:heme oxygenase
LVGVVGRALIQAALADLGEGEVVHFPITLGKADLVLVAGATVVAEDSVLGATFLSNRALV